jgi:hypothetical protein
MSRRDEHARAEFNAVMANRIAHGPRTPGASGFRREQAYHEPSSRGSGTVWVRHPEVDNQAIAQLQEVRTSSHDKSRPL